MPSATKNPPKASQPHIVRTLSGWERWDAHIRRFTTITTDDVLQDLLRERETEKRLRREQEWTWNVIAQRRERPAFCCLSGRMVSLGRDGISLAGTIVGDRANGANVIGEEVYEFEDFEALLQPYLSDECVIQELTQIYDRIALHYWRRNAPDERAERHNQRWLEHALDQIVAHRGLVPEHWFRQTKKAPEDRTWFHRTEVR